MNQELSESRQESYLRVEGVNLSAFVFDTRDLSTALGASLMLLDAVRVAAEALGLKEGDPGLLSRGASSGLFRIQGDPAEAARKVRERLADVFPHATFVVDGVDSAVFAAAREQLLAANRWRQMQAMSLAVPELNSEAGLAKPACALDGRRPASPSSPAPHRDDDPHAFISKATKVRREFGRSAKQAFYETVSGLTGLPMFAHDFESIAVGSKPLDGKLAVFYADGNGFGGIQTRHCQDPDSQKEWDGLVRGIRADFLKGFLKDEVGVGGGGSLALDSPWRGIQRNNRDKGESCLRFETLLWGGDEVLFVMPAAMGWRFAGVFFDQMSGREFRGERLTHAAALVFCQHHAPIHRIKSLAKDQIVEFTKGKDRSLDTLMAVALESFDHLGTDFKTAMRKRYADLLPLERMIFASHGETSLAAVLSGFAGGVDSLRRSGNFPRSQLRGLVSEIIETEITSLGSFQVELDAQGHPFPPHPFRNAGATDRAALARLRSLFHEGGAGTPDDDVALWLQLEELWDYALP